MELGQKFPQFELANQDGKTVKLSDHAGKWVVVYVYPKDDTPSCTIQATSFTATKEQFDKANIKVLGISPDGVDSHKAFCNKFDLTVELLSDPDFKTLNALEVGQTEWNGVMYWNRTTFVIDPAGKFVKRYDKVVADGHEQALLKDIEELKAQPASR